MVWSFSSSRMFQHCQRQWFIKQYVANANAKKDPMRREAYLLSTLQSLHAWRGSLVDSVISEKMIPYLKHRRLPARFRLLDDAQKLFNEQIAFALNNRMREPGMSKRKAGLSFAALYPVEYNEDISSKQLESAWEDVKNALCNLYEMNELLTWLQSAKRLIPQRSLTYTCHGVRAKMQPDLIVFDKDNKPFIIDWKVHSFGTSSARLQLASYALALIGCNPHIDFPLSLTHFDPSDVGLLEIQLLSKQQRTYTLTQSDIDTVEAYIVHTNMDMVLATEDQPKQFSLFDFPAALRASTCQRCNFRALCWMESK